MLKFIRENHVGRVTTFGKYTRTMDPGLNYYIPIVQRVQTVSLQTFNANQKINVRTKDNAFATLDVNVTYKVSNPFVYIYQVANPLQIMHGLIEQHLRAGVETMTSKLGVDSKTAMDFILNSMLMDSYKELTAGNNSKTIFYPTSMKDSPFVWNTGRNSLEIKDDM